MKKEISGYAMKDVIETRLSHFFDGSFGMIYPLLRKLEKEELIKKQIVIQNGKPNKNLYSITTEGAEDFKNYLTSEVEADIFKSDFLMRMYFAEYLSTVEIKELIIDEISRKKNHINQLESSRNNWSNDWTRYQKLTCDIGIEQYRSNVAVLEEFLLSLEDEKAT